MFVEALAVASVLRGPSSHLTVLAPLIDGGLSCLWCGTPRMNLWMMETRMPHETREDDKSRRLAWGTPDSLDPQPWADTPRSPSRMRLRGPRPSSSRAGVRDD